MNLPSNPTSLTSSSTGPTSITLTWSQPPGEVVDTYQISYSFGINGCPGQGGDNIMIPPVSGSLREYTLTGVQEDSEYTIRISAGNGAGDSATAQTMATTLTAGITMELHPC